MRRNGGTERLRRLQRSLPIGEAERLIGGCAGTYPLREALGGVLAADVWTEKSFALHR